MCIRDSFLTQGNTIVEIGDTSIFTITTPGTYTINRFIYNPAQLNLNTFTPGTTSIFDVNALLAQGGGQFCGALGLQGTTVEATFCSNTSNPTTTDTVNLVLPVNTQDSICVVLEPGFDLTNSTFTLASGGTTGVSAFGVWTISPEGCLIYNSNGTPGVTVDTITIIVTNTNGGVDTTVVFVTITDGTMTGCPPIITTGTFDVTTSDCANGGTYCLDIPFDNISDFNLSDNGGIYIGGFRGCDFMMTLETNMTSFFANVDPGPFNIEWTIDGVSFTGTANNVNELVDSMNVWDTTGDWVLITGSMIVRGGNMNTLTEVWCLVKQVQT